MNRGKQLRCQHQKLEMVMQEIQREHFSHHNQKYFVKNEILKDRVHEIQNNNYYLESLTIKLLA